MKKIFTLSAGFFLSFASFAFAPNRLIVSAEANAAIKVTVDGSRLNQVLYDNSVVFENLVPGFHAVKVYQLNTRNRFNRGRGDDYRLVYTASINIKPLFETSIEISRFGNANIDETPIRTENDRKQRDFDDRKNRGRDFDNHDDHASGNDDYGRNNDSYEGNNVAIYNRPMNNDEFFSIKRMLEREEFDNTRLVIAKHIVDVNELTSLQAKEMAALFAFDNSRLDFAKYAYNKNIDKDNYVVVCNTFSFNSSKEQLMHFLRNR